MQRIISIQRRIHIKSRSNNNLKLFYADVQMGIGEEAFRDCTNLKSVRLSTEKELLMRKKNIPKPFGKHRGDLTGGTGMKSLSCQNPNPGA